MGFYVSMIIKLKECIKLLNKDIQVNMVKEFNKDREETYQKPSVHLCVSSVFSVFPSPASQRPISS